MSTLLAIAALSVGVLTDCLRELERGPSSNPWQIKPATWRDYSALPMHRATIHTHRSVAQAHVTRIIARYLPALGLPETPENVALVWNAGFGTVEKRRTTRAQRDFATRVGNLYRERQQPQTP